MIEAATSYRKNGFNDSDSAQLAQISSMFQNVADETISAGDAADFIISQLIAFNQTTGDVASNATHLIDAVNEVANSFSVSSGDLSQGLSVVASTSAAMGNSLESTVGMMVAITEQTRSASKASRGLNTIMSRLSEVLDESSSNGKKIAQIYADLGLSMKDSNGQLKSGYELLSDLAGKWNTLDGNTQKYIATTIGSTTQLNNFLALMNNFDHAVEATNTAINSQGSALKENERAIDSIQGKQQALNAIFEEFANNIIDNELVKNVLDLANGFLKLANTDFGQFVTQVVLLSGVGWGATELFKVSNLLPTVIGQFKEFGAVLGLVKDVNSLSSAFSLLGMSGGALLPILGSVAAAFVLIKKGVDVWKELHPTLEEANAEIESNTAQLEANQKRLEEINNIPWYNRTSEIDEEIKALQEENAELQENIAWLQERNKAQGEKLLSRGFEFHTGEDRYTATMGYETFEIDESQIERFEKLGYTIENVGKTAQYTGDELKTELATRVEYLSKAFENGAIESDAYAQSIWDETIAALDKLAPYYPEIKSLQDKLNFSMSETAEVVAEVGETLSDVSFDFTALSEAAQSATEKTSDIAELLKTVNDGLADDSNWKLPIETLQEINSLLPDSIDKIYNAVDAQEYLNVALVESENVAKQAYANMLLSNGDFVAGVIQNSSTLQSVLNQNYGIDYSNWKDLDSSKLTADTALINKLASMWSKYMGMTKEQVQNQLKVFRQFNQYLTENDRQEIKAMESYLAYLDEAEKGLKELEFSPETISSTKSATKATKDLADATEDATDAAKDAKEAYEDWLDSVGEKLNAVISYMTEYASREIDKLQSQIDAIDDEIDAVNEKYNAKIDAIDEQNNALEKQIQLEEKLKALAEAKSKQQLVFKDGQFQYISDVDTIGSAQADIDAYNRELLLEQQKDAIEEQRDNELEQLENSKSALEQEQERWQEYKDGWSNLEGDYEYYQNEIIAKQEFGIEMENSNWQTRLGYFDSFNQSYNNYQQLLLQSQQYTADAEAEIWNQRLTNAQNFMSQYNAIFGLGTTEAKTSGSSTTSVGYAGTGLTTEYDYNDGIDYGEKILQSTSWAEAQHWAQQRTNAAAWRGLDISGEGGYKSNQELLKELYLKNPNIFSGSSGSYMSSSEAQNQMYAAQYGANSAQYWAEQFGLSQDYVKSALQLNTNQGSASDRHIVSSDVARANKLAQIQQIEKQIAENSAAWFNADEAEKQVLHEANEKYRQLVETLKENLDNPNAGFAGFSYALGTKSASGGLSLVGEQGPELRVLNSGDGIIPADITRNLWDWGKFNPKSMMSTMSQVFNIDNLTLPNAHDAAGLIAGLRQMAYQRAYKRA